MASGAVSGCRSLAASENRFPTAQKYASRVTSRDATELPPGHGAGTKAEDEYAPIELLGGLIEHRFYPELWDVCNEPTELAKRDD
jgi:hypothetical protein